MKICYIANARIPSKQAHGVQIMKMCEAFAELGHKVTLVLPDRRIVDEDPFAYYGVKQNFAIKKLRTIDTVRFGKLGFWFHKILFSLMAAGFAFQHKTYLVYSRDDWPLLFLSFFVRHLAWESHSGRYNPTTHRVIKAGVKLVVISEGLRDFYKSKGVEEDRILVAHDAISLKDFDTEITKEKSREHLNLPLDEKVVMYIGAIKDWKGFKTLLEVSKYSKSGARVVIIGGTEKSILPLIKLYSKAIFLGFRPYRELPMNQRAADILVIPNLTTYDPFERFTSPLKVFAHMASNVPIVASNVPALREVLSEESALFFRSGDWQDLADKIRETLKHPHQAAARAKRAREKVEEYTWHKRAISIINHVQSR